MRRKFGLVLKGESGLVSPWATNNFDLNTGVPWSLNVLTNSPLNIDGSSPFDWRNLLSFNNPSEIRATNLEKNRQKKQTLQAIGQGISSLLDTGISAVKAYKPVETTQTYDTGMGAANSIIDTAVKIPGLQGYAIAAKGALQVLDLSNNLFSTHVDEFQEDTQVRARQNANFGGLYATVDEAKAASGKDYGWLSGGGKEAQLKRDEAINLLAGATLVDKEAQDDFAAANDPVALIRKKAKLQGSITPLRLSAKEGMKFEYKDYSDIVEFQKGGSFNIIPEGALHARKHHIDIDNITKKGIPVISEDNNGKITLQAEIEHSEIILRLEVTEKLENLMKLYNNDSYTLNEKDNFAIEAGKLLTNEILYNTDDRTNLIKEVKK